MEQETQGKCLLAVEERSAPDEDETCQHPTITATRPETNRVAPTKIDTAGEPRNVRKRSKPKTSVDPELNSRLYRLDPTKISDSPWANRSKSHFQSAEFAMLRDDIAREGGNITPVELTLTQGSGPDDENARFEVIFGHSRVRACRELNLLVRAIVTVGLSDCAVVRRMHVENKIRSDTTPYEDGVSYQQLLTQGVFRSSRQLARHLNVDVGLVSKALQLAKLDPCIVTAFGRSSDLQFSWGKPLTDAWDASPDEMAIRAARIVKDRAAGKVLDKHQVLDALLGRGGDDSTQLRRRLKKKAAGHSSILKSDACVQPIIQGTHASKSEPNGRQLSLLKDVGSVEPFNTSTLQTGKNSFESSQEKTTSKLVSGAGVSMSAKALPNALLEEALDTADSLSPANWAPLVSASGYDFGFIATTKSGRTVASISNENLNVEDLEWLAIELSELLMRAPSMCASGAGCGTSEPGLTE